MRAAKVQGAAGEGVWVAVAGGPDGVAPGDSLNVGELREGDGVSDAHDAHSTVESASASWRAVEAVVMCVRPRNPLS